MAAKVSCGPAPTSGRQPLRIVLVAYACGVTDGSEPGVGWVWARLLAEIGEVWVVTSRVTDMNQELEARLVELGLDGRVHTIYVDLPRPWSSPRLRSDRLPRFERMAYVAWQLAVWRGLHRRPESFDIAWHVTYANLWIGSIGPLLAPRFIFGPVGGGVGMPWRLTPTLGWRNVPMELVRAAVRGVARCLNPLARLAWSRAILILTQNPETMRWLPESARSRAVVFPNAVLELDGAARTAGEPRKRGVRDDRASTAPLGLVVGRLIPLKGVVLAINALQHLPGWRLRIIGSGPDEARLRARAADSGLADRVEFTGLLPRTEVLEMMRDEADVLFFPSLHEEGGWAVAEAGGCGLPVVCLDRGGPPVLGGIGVPASTPGATSLLLARAAARAVETRPERTIAQWGLEARRSALIHLLVERGILPFAPSEAEAE